MLKQQDYSKIKKALLTSERPYFFYHDDPDGLCSFLLLYRFVNKGKGTIIKKDPRITVDFVKKVKEYGADKVFITDIAMVDQEFIDEVGVPIVWIDHHPLLERKNVMYFNSRQGNNSNQPATFICYNVVKQDLWLATVGAVADFFIPNYIKEFMEQYPNLVSKKDLKSPNNILFGTKLGELIRVFSFALKGNSTDYTKNVKVLSRIESPLEILNQESAQGKFLYKQYKKITDKYEKVKKSAMNDEDSSNLLVYTYDAHQMSFSGELSTEVLFKFPDKFIIIARKKSGRYKCSLRSAKYIIPPILKKVLQGIDGTGGGHEHACGANISEKDFPEFIERIKQEI